MNAPPVERGQIREMEQGEVAKRVGVVPDRVEVLGVDGAWCSVVRHHGGTAHPRWMKTENVRTRFPVVAGTTGQRP